MAQRIEAGDPCDFAQGRLFAAPEKRLRQGWQGTEERGL